MSEVIMCSKCKTWVPPGAKTCPKCGSAIVTREMMNQAIVQKDEAQEQRKRNSALILSIVVFVFATLMVTSSFSDGSGLDFMVALPIGAIAGWFIGGIPCGWVGVADFRQKISWLLIIIPIGWLLWVMLVFTAAVFAGMVLFPAYLISFLVNLVKKKKA